jgi:hypothetical protein
VQGSSLWETKMIAQLSLTKKPLFFQPHSKETAHINGSFTIVLHKHSIHTLEFFNYIMLPYEYCDKMSILENKRPAGR